MTRLTAINNSFSNMVTDRPTIDYFKNVLKTYDKKIDAVADFMNERIDQMEGTKDEHVKEIKQLDYLLNQIRSEMNTCMLKKDATKIWQYLQRFPHYEELKELNDKFLPELAKAEVKLAAFKLEMEQHQQIILKFDETLAQKGNKSEMEQLSRKLERDVVTD